MRFYIPCSYLGDMNGRILYPIIILCLVSILIVAGFTLLSPHGMQPGVGAKRFGGRCVLSTDTDRRDLQPRRSSGYIRRAVRSGGVTCRGDDQREGRVDGRPIDLILIDGKSNLSTVTAASEELARMEVPVIIGVERSGKRPRCGRPRPRTGFTSSPRGQPPPDCRCRFRLPLPRVHG
jgi:hypothetical protein